MLLAGPAAAAPAADVTVGDLRVVLTTLDGVMPGSGLRVFYRGLPFITRTSVNAVSPNWDKTFFSLGRSKGKSTVSAIPGGKRILYVSTSDAFDLEYRIDVLEGNRLVLDAAGTLRKDAPAIIEYSAGYFSAVALAGQPYRAITTEGERTGTLPFNGSGTEPKTALVAPPLRRIEVQSRLGTLTVDGPAEGPGLDLFDARNVPSPWLQESPIFWLGYLTLPLEANRPFRSQVALQLAPVPESARPDRSAPAVAALPIQDVPDARLPAPAEGPVIPAPQEMRPGRGAFTINEGTRILVGPGAAATRAARELQDRLREDYGIAVPTAPATGGQEDGAAPAGVERPVQQRQPPDLSQRRRPPLGGSVESFAALGSERRNVIVVGLGSDAGIRTWLAEIGVRPVSHAEGYALRVTRDYALLAGADARGALYGAFTLLQTARRRGTAEVSFPATTVRDWPALPVRGVHLLTDNWSAFLHRDLIRRVLAPHKINTIILECEYVKWDSHPEIHAEWGMSKEDVRGILALARDYHIEVIPLVQLLGHVGWMFQNGRNLDLAEDPQAKYAYCPSNPKTYRLVEDVLGEAVALFGRPRLVHIGHDEFTHRGKFGEHEACKGKSIADLFVADTLRIREFLARHGARTMMWGDMVLGPGEAQDAANASSVEEARALRERLPKDILIADWHYAPAPAYPSIKILRDAGFEVWAATWYRPENIAGFARAAAQHGNGLLQTTWTGYYGNMTAVRREFAQFSAYILAAGFAWNPAGPPADSASSAAAQRFLDAWPAAPRSTLVAPGFTVGLVPLATLPMVDTPSRDGWLGYGPEHDLSALPAGAERFGALRFRLPASGKAVALAGPLLPARYPESVVVPIGRPAAQIALMMTAGWAVAETRKVGQVTVRYTDGTELPVDLLYGWNIRAASDARPAVLAPIVWQGKSAGGDPLSLRAFTLWNPFPRKQIAALEFTSAGTEAAPVLLAVTGLE